MGFLDVANTTKDSKATTANTDTFILAYVFPFAFCFACLFCDTFERSLYHGLCQDTAFYIEHLVLMSISSKVHTRKASQQPESAMTKKQKKKTNNNNDNSNNVLSNKLLIGQSFDQPSVILVNCTVQLACVSATLLSLSLSLSLPHSPSLSLSISLCLSLSVQHLTYHKVGDTSSTIELCLTNNSIVIQHQIFL